MREEGWIDIDIDIDRRCMGQKVFSAAGETCSFDHGVRRVDILESPHPPAFEALSCTKYYSPNKVNKKGVPVPSFLYLPYYVILVNYLTARIARVFIYA